MFQSKIIKRRQKRQIPDRPTICKNSSHENDLIPIEEALFFSSSVNELKHTMAVTITKLNLMHFPDVAHNAEIETS